MSVLSHRMQLFTLVSFSSPGQQDNRNHCHNLLVTQANITCGSSLNGSCKIRAIWIFS